MLGLGLLGGGIATTNWLAKLGAKVTVTDLKTEQQLASSIKRIKGDVRFHLGGHTEEDINHNDIIVINPDISYKNRYVKLARELGKLVENEATLFYRFARHPIIGVTGTRGKTTTTNWIKTLLDARYTAVVAGNSPSHPLLKVLETVNRAGNRRHSPAPADQRGSVRIVNEIPSFHLELFDANLVPARSPDIAVITNLYRDHMNRYQSLEEYAGAKANIFAHQTAVQHLILNHDNDWTPFFLGKAPCSTVWLFSTSSLPVGSRGVFLNQGAVYFQTGAASAKSVLAERVLDVAEFGKELGQHNIENLLPSALAAHLSGVSWSEIGERLSALRGVPFRQETILENERIKVVNDTTATTPEGCIAAVKRFGDAECVLIAGGTDGNLEYTDWGETIPKYIKPENLILLSGSATNKMIQALAARSANPAEDTLPDLADFSQQSADVKGTLIVRDTLLDCIRTALATASKYPRSVLLFSPAAKSFEKFKNEMDRGKRFNKLIARELKKSTKP